MGVCCAFIKLSDENVQALIQQPNLVYVLLGIPVVTASRSSGFFGRLFGRKSTPTAPAAPANLPDPRSEGDETDVDKAWQAIHFLLTGSAEPVDGPLGFMMSGGAELEGTDVGYGAPRAFSRGEVASIISAISPFDRTRFRDRYQPQEMDKRGVYPQIWTRDGEEGFDYIWHHFDALRQFLEEAKAQKQGMLVFFC